MTHNIATALTDRTHPVDELEPHPHNARRRDARAQAELRRSLQTNGQYRTVIARRLPDGRLQLLAGHGTVDAARSLGWDRVAVDVHDGIDDEAAARIVAVDNRTSDLAGYDDEMLAELLALIPDLDGSGYSDADLAELRANIDAAAGKQQRTDPDQVPATPVEPVSRPGDVWILGPHRLAVGDGADPAAVAAALGQVEHADLLITDPPYNVAYTGKTRDALTIAGDDQDAVAFEGFLTDLLSAAVAAVKPGGPAYVFHADTEGLAFRRAFVNAGWELKQVLVWVKDTMVLGRQDHHWQHEPILYGWRPGAAHAWYGGRVLTTLLDDGPDVRSMKRDELVAMLEGLLEETTAVRADRPKRNAEHPTMKPVALLERLLERSSRRGGVALDTCAGSGSLAIACHAVGRRAALVELDPRYADVICRRYQEHTGIVPVREADTAMVDFTTAAGAVAADG